MGGIGSGRHWQFGADTTDDYRSIDIRWLKREGLLKSGISRRITWSRGGEVTGSINIQSEPGRVILDYRHRDQGGEWQPERYPVYLDTTPCHMGGERHWFLCPVRGCGRRVRNRKKARRIRFRGKRVEMLLCEVAQLSQELFLQLDHTRTQSDPTVGPPRHQPVDLQSGDDAVRDGPIDPKFPSQIRNRKIAIRPCDHHPRLRQLRTGYSLRRQAAVSDCQSCFRKPTLAQPRRTAASSALCDFMRSAANGGFHKRRFVKRM